MSEQSQVFDNNCRKRQQEKIEMIVEDQEE